jgi:hypothetical protein
MPLLLLPAQPPKNPKNPNSVKFDTHTVVNGQMAEHPIVHAANVALENTGKTLTWMLTPPLLKPLVWRAVALLPPPLLASLNVARMKLYTAALTLARNAMERLGTPWNDELRVTQAFGELVCTACHTSMPWQLFCFRFLLVMLSWREVYCKRH